MGKRLIDPCEVADCSDVIWSTGLCKKHAWRMWRYGSVEDRPRRVAKPKTPATPRKEAARKDCVSCGASFKPSSPRSRFCSRACLNLSYPPRVAAICPTCGNEFEYVRSQERKHCSVACAPKNQPPPRPRIFTAEQRRDRAAKARAKWRKEHREHLKAMRGFYRAALKSAYVERVEFRAIYQRDRGVCGICHRKVEPDNASLDHILPISLGGAHAPWNVRVTHLACNLGRGNRGAAQLRMAIA